MSERIPLRVRSGNERLLGNFVDDMNTIAVIHVPSGQDDVAESGGGN